MSRPSVSKRPKRLCSLCTHKCDGMMSFVMSSAQIFKSHPRASRLIKSAKILDLETLRTKCVTSTNVATIANACPYSNRADLIWRKASRRSPNFYQKNSIDQQRGIDKEARALDLLSEKLNLEVYSIIGYWRHPRFRYMVASPDGIVSNGALVEVKAPRYRKWIIPERHELQIRFDMWVTDSERAYYVQLVDDEIFVETLLRDDAKILDLLPEMQIFHRELTCLHKHFHATKQL